MPSVKQSLTELTASQSKSVLSEKGLTKEAKNAFL